MNATWQREALEALTTLARHDRRIRALIVFGSVARKQVDFWSDLDVLLVVADSAFEQFSTPLAWIAPLGDIYAYERHTADDSTTLRVCLWDFRRLDLVVLSETAFVRNPPPALAQGHEIAFGRTPVTSAAPGAAVVTSGGGAGKRDELERLVQAFWFKAVLVVSKTARRDWLVATHLLLGLVQDVCVAAMLLQEQSGNGTSPPSDGEAQRLLAELPAIELQGPALLTTLTQICRLFEQLALRLVPAYTPRAARFSLWLDQVWAFVPTSEE